MLFRSQGWALGDAKCSSGNATDCATLLRTLDGGATWRAIGVPDGLVSTKDSSSCGTNGTIAGPCVDQIRFATQLIGYAWGYRSFFMTTDGGDTWQSVDAPQTKNLVIARNQVVRLSALGPCSSGCAYNLYSAPIGSDTWTVVTPGGMNHGGTNGGPVGGGPTGISKVVTDGAQFWLLDQTFVTEQTTREQLYESSDGSTWSRVNSRLG